MCDDLLAKEKEFHRLNRQLGEKTQDLMRQVDSVLTSHSTSVFPSRVDELPRNFSPQLRRNEQPFLVEKKKTGTNEGCVENLVRPTNEGSQPTENMTVEEILSNEAENSRSEAFVRFLKAKIKLLHEELQTLRTEYKKKSDYCRDLEIENKKIDDSRLKLHNQTILLKDTIAKLETNNANAQTEIQARGCENSALKKEIERLKKEVKTVNQQSNNLDTRLNRSLEDNERLQNIVKSNKIEEKDLRDQIRRLQESGRISVKNLEKQRNEILQAFKKQTILVDNLKKQKAYLEASRQIQLTEEEFAKLLDWNSEEA